jgi:hypothetical protein
VTEVNSHGAILEKLSVPNDVKQMAAFTDLFIAQRARLPGEKDVCCRAVQSIFDGRWA